jgi:NAD(P)H-nitrite reductase large subunit
LTVGVSPNIDFLKTSGLKIGRGVVVDDFLATSDSDVYAIGDCAEIEKPRAGRRPIEAIWYTGRQMGKTVAHTICEKKTHYEPRLWFNSAKFFDIEYQIYGDVPAQKPPEITSLYWEHTGGKKAVRINFDTETGVVRGFHLMGIRYRHEVCEKWILEKTHVETVLQNLALANFEPEFYKTHELDLINLYNQLTNSRLFKKSTGSLNKVLTFLSR